MIFGEIKFVFLLIKKNWEVGFAAGQKNTDKIVKQARVINYFNHVATRKAYMKLN